MLCKESDVYSIPTELVHGREPDDEYMALNKQEEQWVRNSINQQSGRLGFRRIAVWLQKWGALGSVISLTVGAILTMLGITLTSVYFAVTEKSANAEFRGKTDQRLTDIEKSISALTAIAAASDPANPLNQKKAREVLAEVRQQQDRRLSPEVVQRAGESFIGASAADANAWEVALDYISYRTSLNSASFFATGRVPEATSYTFREIPGKPAPSVSKTNTGVPMEEAAQLAYLGNDKNIDKKVGPQFLILTGGAISIDSTLMRNVVLENVEVHYSGGPLSLENVTFVNCRFIFVNDHPSRRLGMQVLASNKVTFQHLA